MYNPNCKKKFKMWWPLVRILFETSGGSVVRLVGILIMGSRGVHPLGTARKDSNYSAKRRCLN